MIHFKVSYNCSFPNTREIYCACCFHCTHADVVALTGCARSSLGVCASSSGAIAGCVQWVEGGEAIDCSATTGGKRVLIL